LSAVLFLPGVRSAGCTALPTSTCPGPLPAFTNCQPLAGPLTGPLTCAGGLELFVNKDGNSPWTKGHTDVQCNAPADKWTVTTPPAAKVDVDKSKTIIVCAKPGPVVAPSTPCQQCAPIGAATCNAAEGCTTGAGHGTIVENGCNVLKCKNAGEYFISTETTGSVDTITCNAQKEWNNAGTKITKAVCIKGYSCKAKTGKLTSDCNNPKFVFDGCDMVDTSVNDQDVTCNNGKKLFYLPDTKKYW
ncbi:hypothetical protein PMAYCL1PPCAC_21816, partial [Pristionchus mayeri]